MKQIINIFYSVLLIFTAVACQSETPHERILMVSIPPQKYVLDQIVGDKFTVECMLRNAASAESYDPEMSQIMLLEKSDAYFFIGNLPFERIVDKKLSDLGKDDRKFHSEKGIKLICGHHHHGEVDEHEFDPHVWMSVNNMRIIARNMTDAVCRIDSVNANFYRQRLNALDLRLDSLANATATKLKGYEGKAFIVWHPSLSYFAADYGLHQISMEYEGKEAPIGQIQHRLKEAQEMKASVFFAQEGGDENKALAICRQARLRSVTINPLSEDWINEFTKITDELAK